MTSFKKTIQNRKHWFIGLVVYNLYFFLYYWSINYLTFGVKGALIQWSTRWQELMFKQISTFTFEPIGLLQNFGIQFYVVPVNILIGLFIGLLVFMNVTAALYIYSLPKQCRLDYKYNGLIGILPSFLTGFACCAPTFLISIASVFGSSIAFLSSLFIWFLPLSIILLVFGLYKSYKIIGVN